MTEDLFKIDCIRTYTGQYVNVVDPKPETIIIKDIAHSLSLQCRFGGHLKSKYSVAQHSIDVCLGVKDRKLKLQAIMHDASEAYLMDIPSPLKRHLTQYRTIEKRMMFVIADKFGFDYPLSQEVVDSDRRQLDIEWNRYMINKEYYNDRSHDVEMLFLNLFNIYSK
jgi:hypothetical protein